MEVTNEMIDAGAKALRERNMAGRRLNDWSLVPKSQRRKWEEQARTVLEAAVAAS